MTLAQKLFDQGYTIQGLIKTFKKFYGRYVDDVSRYDASVTKIMSDAIPYFDIYHLFSHLTL